MSLTEYNMALHLRNHHQLLILLKASPDLIHEAAKNIEMTIKHAILYAAPTDELEKELKNLHTYPELEPLFLRETKNSALKFNETIGRISSTRKDISGKESFRNVSYTVFLLLNVFGLGLGLLVQTDGTTQEQAGNRERRRRNERNQR